MKKINILFTLFLILFSLPALSNEQSFNEWVINFKKYALEIVQMIHINTGHQMCIPKTFWLKIIQRKYKNYYKKLQERIRRAKHPKALFKRQITGKRF